MKPKVSFDFDDTLSNGRVQHLAKLFIKEGFDVWIVTSRLPDSQAPQKDWNNDLWFVCEQLNVPKDNVVFTAYTPKYEMFWDRDDFLFHLDDDVDEIDGINKMSDTQGVHFPYGNRERQVEILNELKEKFL